MPEDGPGCYKCRITKLEEDNAKLKAQIVEVQIQAFLRGAKHWEFKRTGATMWPSDQNDVLAEAELRYDPPVNSAEKKDDEK